MRTDQAPEPKLTTKTGDEDDDWHFHSRATHQGSPCYTDCDYCEADADKARQEAE